MGLKKSMFAATLLMSSVLFAQESEVKGLSISPISDEVETEVLLDLESHRFSVRGSCNTFMGSVEIDGNDLFLIERDRMATTLMACPEEAQLLDNRLIDFMTHKPKVVRNGSELYLVGSVGEETGSYYIPVTLDRGKYKDLEARTYEQTFIYVSHEKVACEEGSDEQCLQIREDKLDPWEVYRGTIKGFKPQENVDYRLRLKEYTDEEGEKEWVLDMIVEQAIVDQQ